MVFGQLVSAKTKIWLIIIGLSCWISLVVGQTGDSQKSKSTNTPFYNRYWNDLARFLAGMEGLPGSMLEDLDKSPAAINHRKVLSAAFAQKETNLMSKFRKFIANEMPEESATTGNVLYPFSGADFFTIAAVYPKAKHYVFWGLEPEGKLFDIRTLSQERLAANLNGLDRSISDLLKISYFITKSMLFDFTRNDLRGVTPILMLFMARSGYTVLDVKPVKIIQGGQVIAIPLTENIPQSANDDIVTGVEILFRKNDSDTVQTLHYFSFDAQNIRIKYRENDFLAYLDTFKPSHIYLKSASYLMHWENYQIIRDRILKVTDFVLQDDTGIAFRFFDKNRWEFKVYGNYMTPIQPFQAHYQHDYARYFTMPGYHKPLDFTMGYRNDPRSTNLLIARLKK